MLIAILAFENIKKKFTKLMYKCNSQLQYDLIAWNYDLKSAI